MQEFTLLRIHPKATSTCTESVVEQVVRHTKTVRATPAIVRCSCAVWRSANLSSNSAQCVWLTLHRGTTRSSVDPVPVVSPTRNTLSTEANRYVRKTYIWSFLSPIIIFLSSFQAYPEYLVSYQIVRPQPDEMADKNWFMTICFYPFLNIFLNQTFAFTFRLVIFDICCFYFSFFHVVDLTKKQQ